MIKISSMSLRLRFGICIAALNIAIITVLSMTAYHEFRENLDRRIDNSLISQAKSVSVSIAADDSLLEARREIQAFFGPANDPRSTIYRIWFEAEQQYHVDNISLLLSSVELI
jgi:hypothetical protein